MEKFRESLKVKKERAVLVGAIVHRESVSDGLSELSALAQSAGAVVVDHFQQKIRKISAATYIGKGKAERLRGRVQTQKADVVIFDNDLSPRQIGQLEEIINVKVLDRSELILDIFANRAKTRQAKLQVELAQLEYTYPRLTRMWSHLDTLAGAGGAGAAGAVGGIGTRGPGEKQLEIDRRLVTKRISELKQDLATIDQRKIREIEGRTSTFKICLVGYTNAGKSTLLNALTDSEVLVEDRLFATLDTKTRKWNLARGADALLSDTVGFVRNLPHQLIASFKATLEEAVNADLLLHVVDVSNPEAHHQIESVNSVLAEIGCGEKPIIMLFNKSDAIRSISEYETLETIYTDTLTISAKTGFGFDELTKTVLGRFRGSSLLLRVTASQSDGKVQSFLRAFGKIISEEYSDGSVQIDARLGSNQMPQLRRLRPVKIEMLS
ncbi:MAG: GTPase HflX [Planctomycetota bacterium]